jgi:exosortase
MRENEKNAIRAVVAATAAGAFAWSYWPTLASLIRAWNSVPDYSHGYFVVPAAVFILWARRQEYPGASERLAWLGLGLVGLSVAVRALGAHYFLDAIDGWSILLWVGGAIWFLFGWQIFRWSLPSVAFLWFMIPLPFRLEHALSRPLQHAASRISCWVLQCLGQPALPEGTRIYLGDMELQVSQECAGLRIFVGIAALAFVFIVLVRRTWWERALLAASVIPVAVAANVTRIVATGMLFQWFGSESAHAIIHDWAGYLMIPYSAALFALVVLYLGRLVQTVELADAGEMARSRMAEA